MDILRKQLSDKEAEYKEGKAVLKRSNKTFVQLYSRHAGISTNVCTGADCSKAG